MADRLTRFTPDAREPVLVMANADLLKKMSGRWSPHLRVKVERNGSGIWEMTFMSTAAGREADARDT